MLCSCGARAAGNDQAAMPRAVAVLMAAGALAGIIALYAAFYLSRLTHF
jgi:hypothetical protein